MKTNQIKAGGLAVVLVALVTFSPVAFAAAQSVSHGVSVSIPAVLQITADTTSFTLTMSDYVSGTVSDTKTVLYTVRSNNNGLATESNLVTAKMGIAFTGIDLKADPGVYTKIGGNFSLAELSAAEILIGTLDTALMKKTGMTGTGKSTRGTFPVVYKAVATADLESQTQTQTLTITVVDA